jgi:type I restriction enzyme R subunit
LFAKRSVDCFLPARERRNRTNQGDSDRNRHRSLYRKRSTSSCAYSEQRGAKGEGSAALFYYNQIVIATCRQDCKFGTIATHGEKLFFRWADPFPRTVNDLEHGGSSPNDQQRLVAGMLDRNNRLDIIRTLNLFSTNDKDETTKVVGRYQQFRAVKLAVKRLLEGKTPRERSGIVWHTQGSGKSQNQENGSTINQT